MTSANIAISGQRRIVSSTPANTSEATLFTANDDTTSVVQIWATNLTAAAANATIKWGDGSTDYALVSVFSVPARGYLVEDVLIPMRDGYTIKITSGTGSALTFTAVVVEAGGSFGSPLSR